MTCRDTEHLWNERLDARGDEPEGAAEALRAHAEGCPACAVVDARYRRLAAAIVALRPPAPSERPDLRVIVRGRPVGTRDRLGVAVGAWPRRLAAAALIAAGIVGLRATRVVDVPPPPGAPARSLADALADATAATLSLAREASAPAGRVGRVVLASARLRGVDSGLTPRVPSVVPTADVLRSVGGRMGAGVAPLSGSARQAFGFLLRTGPADAAPAPRPVPPRGA